MLTPLLIPFRDSALRSLLPDSETNPYESPPTVIHDLPTAVSRGTSLVWFAATVAGLTYFSCMLMATYLFGSSDPAEVFIRSLLPSAMYTIPAVVVYASVRHLLRTRNPFSSTPRSLVVAGIIVAGFVSVVHYFTFSPFGVWVWLVAMALALPVCYFVRFIERWFAGPAVTAPLSPSTGSTHESIFWFSGACLALGLVAGFALQPGPGLYTAILGGIVSSAILCTIGTIVYGALSACFKRSHAATKESRIAAAATFVGLTWIASPLMEAMAVPPGLPRVGIIVVLTPLCVLCDRLVALRAARL
jgi:hypothetical protein